ncbi:hypothetical protein D6D17_10051 [Aureobasidium pullulans]|nr:hypothetical protein D6D17_10051 [Aureobasidium pullulans]
MTSREIAAVVSFPFVDDVLKICTSLLVTVIDGDTHETIKLAHFTVKEFLIVQQIYDESLYWYKFTAQLAHRCITEQALECLFESPPSEFKPLLKYSSDFWAVHARQNDSNADWSNVQAKVDLILEYKNRQRLLNWLKTQYPYEMFPMSGSRLSVQPLYYASLLGLLANVKAYWYRGFRLKQQEGWFGSALDAAAGMGHIDVVRWYSENCNDMRDFIYLPIALQRIQVNIPETLGALLQRGPRLHVTTEMVDSLTQNSMGKEVLEALITGQLVTISINQDLIQHATRNYWDYGVLSVLIRSLAHDLPSAAPILAKLPEQLFKTILTHCDIDLGVVGPLVQIKGFRPPALMTVSARGGLLTASTDPPVLINVILDSPEHLDLLTRISRSWTALVLANYGSSVVKQIFVDCTHKRVPENHEFCIIAGQFDLAIIESILEDPESTVVVSEQLVKSVALNRWVQSPIQMRPPQDSSDGQQRLHTRYRPVLNSPDERRLNAIFGSMMRRAGSSFPITDLVVRMFARKAWLGVFLTFTDQFFHRLNSFEEIDKAVTDATLAESTMNAYLLRGSNPGSDRETWAILDTTLRRGALVNRRKDVRCLQLREGTTIEVSEDALPEVLHYTPYSTRKYDLEGTVFVAPDDPVLKFCEQGHAHNEDSGLIDDQSKHLSQGRFLRPRNRRRVSIECSIPGFLDD